MIGTVLQIMSQWSTFPDLGGTWIKSTDDDILESAYKHRDVFTLHLTNL